MSNTAVPSLWVNDTSASSSGGMIIARKLTSTFSYSGSKYRDTISELAINYISALVVTLWIGERWLKYLQHWDLKITSGMIKWSRWWICINISGVWKINRSVFKITLKTFCFSTRYESVPMETRALERNLCLFAFLLVPTIEQRSSPISN